MTSPSQGVHAVMYNTSYTHSLNFHLHSNICSMSATVQSIPALVKDFCSIDAKTGIVCLVLSDCI